MAKSRFFDNRLMLNVETSHPDRAVMFEADSAPYLLASYCHTPILNMLLWL